MITRPIGHAMGTALTHDGGIKGETVDDGGAEPGVGEGLGSASKLSLEAMATLAVSSLSVRTWKSRSAPRLSSSASERSPAQPLHEHDRTR